MNAFIEIVPTDTVKYELDKTTGCLNVDRPQKFSNVCPTLYGFIPQTYCGEEVGAFCAERSGREGIDGDGDPMDICVLTEKAISHGDILVRAIPIGGLRMLDNEEADDKIVAVLEGDAVYGTCVGRGQAAGRPVVASEALLPHLQEVPRLDGLEGRDHPRLRAGGGLRGHRAAAAATTGRSSRP